MGTTPSVTHTFTSGTKAKASEVNQNFTDIINSLTDGTEDHNISRHTSSERFFAMKSIGNLTITAGNCFVAGFFTIDTGHTYTVLSSATACFLHEVTVNETLDIQSGAEVAVI